MADTRLRELERRWLADPSDQILLAAAVEEHRRSSSVVPPGMLEARVLPATTFRSKLTFKVWAEKPDGQVVELGDTGREAVEIPKHRAWWVAPILQCRRRHRTMDGAHAEQARILQRALVVVGQQRVPGLALGARELFSRVEGAQDVLRSLTASHLLHLEALSLGGFDNTGLEPLQHFKRLRRLDLTHCQAPLRPLRELPELTHLIVVGCPGVDLRDVPRTVVRLEMGWVQGSVDRTMAGLDDLPALARLRVGGGVGDAGVEHISRARGLVDLQFHHAVVTDAGLRRLAKGLPKLESLSLDNCQEITDKAMAAISKMSTLRRLRVDDCGRVTAKGLARLTSLSSLEVLYVRAAPHLHLNEDRTRARIALRKALPNCKIY